MATPRRPRGTRRNPVSLGYVIESQAKERLDMMAARAGVSRAVFLERLIAHTGDELGEDGLPIWWPPNENQELPIAQ